MAAGGWKALSPVVTVQGSSNIVVADNVINDITVDGNDQTVFYKNG